MSKFFEGFEKKSGMRSEVVGTFIPPMAVGSIFGIAAGAHAGAYSDKQQREADKAKWSNMIPGVGAYRLTRRAFTRDRLKEEGSKT